MVHTLELSKMISEETFEELLSTLKDIRYNGIAWYTQSYADKGISMVCLRKFKPLRRNEKGEKVILENEPFQYMIIMSINIGIMFGGDGSTQPMYYHLLLILPKPFMIKSLSKYLN